MKVENETEYSILFLGQLQPKKFWGPSQYDICIFSLKLKKLQMQVCCARNYC